MQTPVQSIKDVKLNYILIMKYDWYPVQVNFNEETITQLKSTGGLTLIEDPLVADAIATYDVGISLCNRYGSIVIDTYKETFSTQKYVYNYRDRLIFQNKLGVKSSNELQKYSNDILVEQMSNEVKLVTTDKARIIACYNDFANYQASLKLYAKALLQQEKITNELINLIKDKTGL
jgi:hypothetical protein